MSAQAEPRNEGSLFGAWRQRRFWTGKKIPKTEDDGTLQDMREDMEQGTKQKTRKADGILRIGRCAAALVAALLLVYYCTHRAIYEGENHTFILAVKKTYVVSGVTLLLMVLALTPIRLKEKANRILSWIWFAAGPFAVYFSLLYMNAEKYDIHFFELNRVALVLTFVFLYLTEMLILVLTGSLRFSVVIPAVLVAVLGIANAFVISFRGMALSAADLFSLEAASSVASEYTYTLDWYMFMEVLCTLAICMVSLKLSGGRMLHPAVRAAILILWCALSGGYYHVCCKTDFLEQQDIRSGGFTHQLRYKQYDMLFTTLTTCFYLSVDKPEGYSLDRVREIAAPYLESKEDGNGKKDSRSAGIDKTVRSAGVKTMAGAGAAGMKTEQSEALAAGADSETATVPDIIVIMNESLADYTDIGRGLPLSEDCMPFIHGLTENTIKGTAYASIFGGNTPNSEYEFLTGNTMGFLPASSVGYNLFVRGALPSVASLLKSEDYTTLAMHPYRGTNYRRHIVYPQIGFDTYYTRDDFKRPNYVRSYISDGTLFQRIISEYNKRRNSSHPLFSYNVTMQNHGGYFASNTLNLDMGIEVESREVDEVKTSVYINLIRETDRQFQKLVEYFEKEEQPTIIVMFGDHQANLGDNTYEYLVGAEEDLTDEERMEKYKVPFVIWTNYDIPEETIEKTSLNYLYSIMADRLGLPMTGYHRYLLDLQKELPVLCAQGCFDADGNYCRLDDETSPHYEKINEYNILEYNDIFGGKDRDLEFFSSVAG